MNKKKRIAILFAVILVVAVGIIIAVTSHQKKEMDFDEFADRFEKSAEEVLGEDVKKVAKTELAATLTYEDQTDKDRTIYYRHFMMAIRLRSPACTQKLLGCFSRLIAWTAAKK